MISLLRRDRQVLYPWEDMNLLILILFSSYSFAYYRYVSIQERMGNRYRHEVIKNSSECEEKKVAEKTFLHDTNELREIAIWDKDGKVRGAAGNKNPKLTAEINAIFAKSKLIKDPCLVPVEKPVELIQEVTKEEPKIEEPETPKFPPGYLQ